jgi:hypothetical protein
LNKPIIANLEMNRTLTLILIFFFYTVLAIPCAQMAYTVKDGCDLRGEVFHKGSIRCYYRVPTKIQQCQNGIATLLGYKKEIIRIPKSQRNKFKKTLKFVFSV